MTVVTPRPTALDLVRSVVVAVLAVAQIVVSALAGQGIGGVADAYATPLLAAGWAFAIWVLIYLGFLAYAGYQLLPSQRGRTVHRRCGWWLAVSTVANAVWILAFGASSLLAAEVVLVVLAVVLAVVFSRLAADPAQSRWERVVFRVPVSIYTGWTLAALAQGTLATVVWVGLPGDGPLTVVTGIVLLAMLTLAAVSVVSSASGIAGFSAAVLWALAGIATNDRPIVVIVVVVLAFAAVVAATVRRISRSVQPVRVAFG